MDRLNNEDRVDIMKSNYFKTSIYTSMMLLFIRWNGMFVLAALVFAARDMIFRHGICIFCFAKQRRLHKRRGVAVSAAELEGTLRTLDWRHGVAQCFHDFPRASTRKDLAGENNRVILNKY
jgi:hypothetical protein